MKVSLISLLALASSAWAKDSTDASRGSNLDYNRNRKLTELETKSAKSNVFDDSTNPRTAAARRAATLALIAQTYLQLMGSWDDVLGTFILWVGDQVSTLENLLPDLDVIDANKDGKVIASELVDALRKYFEGESLQGFYVRNDSRSISDEPRDETSSPFFGFMGVTSAMVFANIGAAYGTAKSDVEIPTV